MREIIRLEDWQKEVEDKYQATPASCRPKKGKHKPRSPQEKLAMAISCKKAWDEWASKGFVVVTEEGYKLCPDALK